ncbi:MAG: efflux RND transporter periplasmic adaptor subunit [Bacteroidetes bacterium]|nr:efflux RND transporter periplasmic adaptor subunit [Bacteroidota bacterium]
MLRNKWFIIGLIAVILLIALVVAKKNGLIGESGDKKVSMELVSRHNIVEIVTASGKVQPEAELKITSDVSGEIVDLFVKEGQVVKKGDLLVKIRPDIYLSDLDRVKASVNTSKSGLAGSKSRMEQAKSQSEKADFAFKRAKQLYDDNVISQQDFENAKSAYDIAKAEVDAALQNIKASEFGIQGANASLKQAQENLNKTILYAPVDGTISSLSKEKGERVVGTNMMDGTEIMRLANLNEMEVIVDVSETDIIRVSMSDTADIEIDAYDDRKFKGVVTEIANAAKTSLMQQSTDQVTNYTVKVRILRDSYKDLMNESNANQSPFRPGMSASVEIRTKEASNVVAVPIQCVTTRDTSKKADAKKIKIAIGGENKEEEKKDDKAPSKDDEANIKECVFVIEDGKAKRILVSTGIQDNNFIEIKTGLKGGEKIITGPYLTISKLINDSDKIKVVSKDELFEPDLEKK